MNGATDAFVRLKIGEPVEARGEAVTGSFVEAADAGRKERPVCGCVKAPTISAGAAWSAVRSGSRGTGTPSHDRRADDPRSRGKAERTRHP